MNTQSQIQQIYQELKSLNEKNADGSLLYRKLHQKLATQLNDNSEPDLEKLITEDPDLTLLEDCQKFQLKNQYLALKFIGNNQKIPNGILKKSSTLSPAQWNIERQTLFENSKKVFQEKVEKNSEFKKSLIDSYMKSGSSVNNDENIKSQLNNQNQLSLRMIEGRKEEITAQLCSNYLTKSAQEELQNEINFLDCLDIYHSLKNNIFQNLKDFISKNNDSKMERLYLDRNFFRREKPQRGPEEKMMEKFELHIKQEQEQRKRMKHREFLSKMFEYSGKFFDFHKKKYTILKKRSNNVKQHIEWLRKKDQKELDKAERERIEAIKAQEFKEYGRLLAEAKNKRITQVLKETDTFLKDIGLKILDLKLKRNEFSDTDAEEMKELLAPPKPKLDENGEEEYDFSASTLMTENYQKFYYNLTHTKIEEVKEQPNLLEGGTLKSYQITGLQWQVSLFNNKLNGILADEMGLGKTIQTIALFCHIMEFKQNTGPFLVVVPQTTLTNWVMEFDKWAPSIKKVIYKGNPTQRKQISQLLKNSKWNVCLTTYEYIMKDKSDLNRFPWQYIVVDEGHKMKNPRSKFAQTLGQQYNSENRLLLTGTPLQNNLPELWSLLNFLLPKVFASCDDFEKWFKLPLKSFGPEKEIELNEEEKLLIIHRFHQALRPFLLRRVKKEVESELPNKIEYVIKVELSAWQKIVYDQIKQKECMAIDPAHEKMGRKTLMNMMMQLRKICNHPYLFTMNEYEYNEDLIRCSGKFELLDRILPKLIRTNHRMLIFTQMTRQLDILTCFFEYRGYKFLRLDGTTKADDRADRMAMFNMPNSDYPIFMLSTRAGGLGLNLQTADTVILVDSDWNPQMDLQAQDRAHRIGSKNEVRVYRLVTNTVIEEEILSKASFKRNLDGMVIQAGLFNQKSTDVERRQRLEELMKKNNAADNDSEEEEIPNDEEINHMLARGDHEFELFSKWDEERYQADKPLYPNTQDLNYRLMKYDSVPDWVKQAPEPKKVITELGKRRRHKNKNINNYDHLDDEDYFRILEQKFEDYDDREPGMVRSDDDGRGSSSKSHYQEMPNAMGVMEDVEEEEEERRRKKKRKVAAKNKEKGSLAISLRQGKGNKIGIAGAGMNDDLGVDYDLYGESEGAGGNGEEVYLESDDGEEIFHDE